MSFLQDSMDAEKASLFKDLGVWNFVLPFDVEELAQPAEGLAIELLRMSVVDNPCLTCVEE